MAERGGFEPPCRLRDKTLSRRPRYDHFGTSPTGTTYGSKTCERPEERAGERVLKPLGRLYPGDWACTYPRLVLKNS